MYNMKYTKVTINNIKYYAINNIAINSMLIFLSISYIYLLRFYIVLYIF